MGLLLNSLILLLLNKMLMKRKRRMRGSCLTSFNYLMEITLASRR